MSQRRFEEKIGGNYDCYQSGCRAAKQRVDTDGPSTGGFFGGLLLGPIGVTLAYAVMTEPQPSFTVLDTIDDRACRVDFELGYGDEGQYKKQGAALLGGILGIVTLAFLATRYQGY